MFDVVEKRKEFLIENEASKWVKWLLKGQHGLRASFPIVQYSVDAHEMSCFVIENKIYSTSMQV